MARKPKVISEFNRELGDAIRHRRLDKKVKLTQKQLAKATGIPLSNLQRREEGENEVTVSELQRIAYFLKTTPATLVETALSRYGGVDKLIAEHGPVSEPTPTVDDTFAKKRAAKESKLTGGQWDEAKERSAAIVDDENMHPEPEAP